MKAQPLKMRNGNFEFANKKVATHLLIKMPGPSGLCYLPIWNGFGKRIHPSWEWNGSTEAPTLTPSILTRIDSEHLDSPSVCHSFVKEGMVQFLDDCTHRFRGQTVSLLDVEAIAS
jgi:hypothetical protein